MVVADQNKTRLVLVSGPSRGGKSRWAEHLMSEAVDVTYVATAPDRPDDQDWQTRLALHRRRRPSHWHLLESGAELSMLLGDLWPVISMTQTRSGTNAVMS